MQRHFVSFGAKIASQEIMPLDTRLQAVDYFNSRRLPKRLVRKPSLYNDDEPLKDQEEDPGMHSMADPAIPEEMKALIRLLDHEKEKITRISYGLMHRPYREAVELLAAEQGKYAAALAARLLQEEWMSVPALRQTDPDPSFYREADNGEKQPHRIRLIFRQSEENIISAYSGLLNKPFLDKKTRLVLRGQRNGMLYSFLCVKLADE